MASFTSRLAEFGPSRHDAGQGGTDCDSRGDWADATVGTDRQPRGHCRHRRRGEDEMPTNAATGTRSALVGMLSIRREARVSPEIIKSLRVALSPHRGLNHLDLRLSCLPQLLPNGPLIG
jgi:hypothetical protein